MSNLPSSFRRLVVTTRTHDFVKATKIISSPLLKPEGDQVLVKNKFVGINATDVNISAGRYFVDDKDSPYPVGLEGLGEIVEVGKNVTTLNKGQIVLYICLGSFAEYLCVPAKDVWPISETKPEYLALMISGRTAAISLDKVGFIKKGENVLITAAAGGTGQIAVQYAKAAGCHVIGTTSTEEKVQLLKSLGCARVINYKKEDIGEVLKKEYPKGVDVIWETIGGDVFNTCLENLAVLGRLIIIGYITSYKKDAIDEKANLSVLQPKLLMNSATVSGFLLFHFAEYIPTYHNKLVQMYKDGGLKILVDRGDKAEGGVFKGIESIGRAVEHLHTGKSMGKVIVEL